jgi:diguanylate cyclase (GGDEF)-like protein
MAGDATLRIDDGAAAGTPRTSAAGGRERAGWVFVGYCLIQAVLVVVGAWAPFPAGGVACLAMVAVGVAVLGISVARRRPARVVGWWLVAAGAASLLAAHVTTSALDGVVAANSVVTVSAIPFALATIPLIGVGLAVLGHRPGTAGALDALDAAMVAAAVLLLSWLAVTNSVTPARSGLTIATFLLPFGVIAVFGTAMKLIMSRGLSSVPVVILELAIAALIASTLLVLLPSIHTSTVTGTREAKVVWAVSGALLGAAGLYPTFGRATGPRRPADDDLPVWRIVAFALITILVPLALAFDLLNRSARFNHSLAGVAGPTTAAIGLLLLLLARLAVTARQSHRQAAVLRQRTGELTLSLERQESLQRELSYRATHDPLTTLANRIVLGHHLQQALDRTGADGTTHALLLLDLDGFKDVNDTYGHPTGDELLTAVAGRLQQVTPSGGLIARLGGDEFAMLLEVDGQAEATALGHRILDTLRPALHADGEELFVSASIGLLIIDTGYGSTSPSDALRDADLSLYAAKNAGKNRIVAFTPQLRADRLEKAGIALGLRHALTQNDICLHYQPVIDLTTGTPVAVEALARWQPADGPPIPPDRFIPVAEATGLIATLGQHILRTACADGSRWHAAHGTAVAVNISGHQLADPGFTDTTTRALHDAGLPPTGLILELTESCLIDTSSERAGLKHLRALQASGVRIAIDDFGTGYSSLSYLATLPVDIVKLDRAFAHPRDDTTGESNWAYTGAILDLIASLGLTAVTEGIETPEQDHALRTLGCRYVQGYLYARPQPADGIDRILRDRPASPPQL